MHIITLVMPFIVIGGSFLASLPYYFTGDWKSGTYWLAAAVINLMATLK